MVLQQGKYGLIMNNDRAGQEAQLIAGQDSCRKAGQGRAVKTEQDRAGQSMAVRHRQT